MQICIEENGCKDREVTIMDTKLPYYYARVCELFAFEPKEVNIVLVKAKEEFCKFRGEERIESEEGAFIKDNTIYIYEPNQFGVLTNSKREDFYRILYQELVHLFYRTNKYKASA